MNRSFCAGLGTLVCVGAVVAAGSIVGATANGRNGAPAPQGAADTHGNKHDCVPMRLETTDYFVDVLSTLPNHLGVPAQIEVRRVRPIYQTGRCRGLLRSAVLVHGRTIDGISAFDVPYQDYSLMTAMANNGIDAFAFNQLGFGASSHFSMDDPCNASRSTDAAVNVNPSNQQNLLLVARRASISSRPSSTTCGAYRVVVKTRMTRTVLPLSGVGSICFHGRSDRRSSVPTWRCRGIRRTSPV